MNLLFVASRDIHEQDGGASRTQILKCNYLASIPGVKVFTAYRHLSSVDPRIIECPIDHQVTTENLRKLIVENNIDIIDSITHDNYLKFAREAVKGTSCKIVTESHIKPSFFIDGLMSSVKTSMRSGSIRRKILGVIKISLFPIYKLYSYYKNRTLYRDAYLFVDRLVVLSSPFIKEYQQYYKLKDCAKTVAIGNTLSFKTEIEPSKISQKKNTLLVVSRLSEDHKRISYILKLWRKIYQDFPHWNLQILGEGPDAQFYKNYVTKHKLPRISFEGRQDPEKYYEDAKIFLMTSAFEGQPMTLLESQQKGCVPVAMDSFSSLSHTINDGEDGVIVENKNLKRFEAKVRELMDNDRLREQMAQKGIKNCQRFRMDNIGSQWIELFNDLKNN